eukprot:13020279-Heterocapsa_arctica.AAC.1
MENCRIGEASNPGPGEINRQSNQIKLVDFFHKMHTPKDDKAERCREKGFTTESIKGDGNCLHTCLGKSRKLSGNQGRQIIHSRAVDLWEQIVEFDTD